MRYCTTLIALISGILTLTTKHSHIAFHLIIKLNSDVQHLLTRSYQTRALATLTVRLTTQPQTRQSKLYAINWYTTNNVIYSMLHRVRGPFGAASKVRVLKLCPRLVRREGYDSPGTRRSVGFGPIVVLVEAGYDAEVSAALGAVVLRLAA